MEQLVARWAHNPKVAGSSPASATKQGRPVFRMAFLYCMFTVYVLYSAKHDKIYIGFTGDLAARFSSHNSLAKKGYTVKFRPWEIAYSEEHGSKAGAMKKEKQLKSATGRKWVWSLIADKYGE